MHVYVYAICVADIMAEMQTSGTKALLLYYYMVDEMIPHTTV